MEHEFPQFSDENSCHHLEKVWQEIDLDFNSLKKIGLSTSFFTRVWLQHRSIHTTWNQRNVAISTNPFAHSEYVEGLCHRQGFWNNEPFLFVGNYLSQFRHSWFQESLPNHLTNVFLLEKPVFFPKLSNSCCCFQTKRPKKASLRLGLQSSVMFVFEGVIRCFMWSVFKDLVRQRFTPWKFSVDTTNWCCAKCNFISKIVIFGIFIKCIVNFKGVNIESRISWKVI